MSEPLYPKEVLRLAAAATAAGRLAPFDAEGTAHNPVCGDRVTMTLRLRDGHVAAIGHETQACVFSQASASILGAHAEGADAAMLEELRTRVAAMLNEGASPPAPFADYAVLRGAASHRGRHTCVLLPIDALLNALRQS